MPKRKTPPVPKRRTPPVPKKKPPTPRRKAPVPKERPTPTEEVKKPPTARRKPPIPKRKSRLPNPLDVRGVDGLYPLDRCAACGGVWRDANGFFCWTCVGKRPGSHHES